MSKIRNTITAITILLGIGGTLTWAVYAGAGEADVGVEAATRRSAATSATVRETMADERSTAPIGQTKTQTDTGTKLAKEPETVDTTTTVHQPKDTTKPENTTATTNKTPGTSKRPGTKKPTDTTIAAPAPVGPGSRIVDNGYINIDGVRVVGESGYDPKRRLDLVERCGHISAPIVVRIWFKYENGETRDETWVLNGKQNYGFYKDKYGNPAWRPVYVDGSGLDPYGEWTEEHGSPPTEWVWCANFRPEDM